jgi:pantoate--beta-alanine ligase
VDDDYRGPALVLVAARVGTTRLIDNERILLAK